MILISVPLALSQTRVHTARSLIWGLCIEWCACLRPSFRWCSFCLPMEGWPGWVELGGWLHTETVAHPSTNRTGHWL